MVLLSVKLNVTHLRTIEKKTVELEWLLADRNVFRPTGHVWPSMTPTLWLLETLLPRTKSSLPVKNGRRPLRTSGRPESVRCRRYRLLCVGLLVKLWKTGLRWVVSASPHSPALALGPCILLVVNGSLAGPDSNVIF